jgi:nucleotidyltransferase substrate binding protein (TIGR01987 family)
MSQDIRWQQRFDNYQRALYQLSLAMELSKQRAISDLEKLGVIQAFKFVHELSWNVIKDFLEYEGISGLVGSRSTVREAFKRGIISDGQIWMDMVDQRNLSSHTYNKPVAEALVGSIVQTFHLAFVHQSGSDTDFQKTGPCSRCGATLPAIVGVREGPLTATHRQQAGSYRG